jgi:anti-sigma B factor antagonist
MDTPADPWRLEGELTIAAIAEQRLHLLAAVEQTHERLALDLGDVEACDSAGVQLLMAAHQSLALRGAELVVTACSPAVREVLRTYGLQSLGTARPEPGVTA